MTAGLLRGGIRPLLFPRSLAVVGASDRTPDGAADLEQVAARRRVPTWFVNPNRPTVLGRECFPSLTALPEVPECAFLLVGHARAEAAFEDVIAAGVRAVVLPGLGAEAGAEGREIAARIALRAAEAGIAVVGPNCMGVATPGGVSQWLGTVAGPDAFVPGHVACVAHSGSIAEACLAAGPRVGFRTVVSSGGELARDLADFVAYLAARRGHARDRLVRRDDPAARGLRRRARAGGRGGQARRLPQGRPLAGGGAGGARPLRRRRRARRARSRRLLRHHGAIEVDDFHDFLETLEVLGRRRWPRGLRIAGVSESGGECGLLADHGEDAGIPFAPFGDALDGAARRPRSPTSRCPRTRSTAGRSTTRSVVYPGSLALLRDAGAYDVLIAQVDLSRHRGAHDEAVVHADRAMRSPTPSRARTSSRP